MRTSLDYPTLADAVTALTAAGHSKAQIAQMLGVSRNGVAYWRQRRPRSGDTACTQCARTLACRDAVRQYEPVLCEEE